MLGVEFISTALGAVREQGRRYQCKQIFRTLSIIESIEHTKGANIFGAPGTPNCKSIWDCQQVEQLSFVFDQIEGVGKEVPQPKDVSSTPCEVLLTLYRAGVYALTQSYV
ncbi:jg12418 [Pararge aegeria aegeria]|uniref:Jg12418 protein n=1 Tax=Pararge aegeria aegeria TaxID=348720 RepID=A0A8S4R888_9NEOP|nr:jg12418 [Pararge aegeria aegeria]